MEAPTPDHQHDRRHANQPWQCSHCSEPGANPNLESGFFGRRCCSPPRCADPAQQDASGCSALAGLDLPARRSRGWAAAGAGWERRVPGIHKGWAGLRGGRQHHGQGPDSARSAPRSPGRGRRLRGHRARSSRWLSPGLGGGSRRPFVLRPGRGERASLRGGAASRVRGARPSPGGGPGPRRACAAASLRPPPGSSRQPRRGRGSAVPAPSGQPSGIPGRTDLAELERGVSTVRPACKIKPRGESRGELSVRGHRQASTSNEFNTTTCTALKVTAGNTGKSSLMFSLIPGSLMPAAGWAFSSWTGATVP